MSLILQALKKAEAERSLGRVPSLDELGAAEPAAARPRHAALWAGLLVATIAVVAIATWWGIDRGAAPVPIVVAPPVQVVVAPPVPVPVEVAPPLPTVVAPALPVAVAPAAPAPAPVAVVVPKPAPLTAPAPAPAQRSTLPAPPPPRAEPAPPSIPELPVALRQALPPLPVTGSIWSPIPGDRMLILAGEVKREGDRITPELELISIGQRAAVLRFRDQAFRLPY